MVTGLEGAFSSFICALAAFANPTIGLSLPASHRDNGRGDRAVLATSRAVRSCPTTGLSRDYVAGILRVGTFGEDLGDIAGRD